MISPSSDGAAATSRSLARVPGAPARLLALVALASVLVLGGGDLHAQGTPEPLRFTGETPDATIAALEKRARAPKATEADRVAALAGVLALSDRASRGRAEAAATAIGSAPGASEEVRGEAAVAARALAADDGTTAGIDKARALGILTDLAVLGPFRDTGGGLDAHDGPEAPEVLAKGAFGAPDRTYSWGSVEVAWRPVPPVFAQADGVPLDLFLHPRKESCSFFATKIRLDAARPVVVRLAASGQARLTFDGADLAKSDDVHANALFDRLAARVDASAGAHVVAAKVCTGALDDAGRVRLRLTDDKGAPLVVPHGPELVAKAGETITWGKVKSTPLTTALARSVTGREGARATPDALLDAAIVRTLAGADDLKSPRAPGQLDALLQTPNLDADRLAMAGWVSPSGANRSARLHAARKLAEKNGDATTRAFVDRRLVEAHLETDMPDWAMATLRGTKLDQQKDAEALSLRARAARALRLDALEIEATRELTAAFRANAATLSDALLLQLSSLARAHDVKTWNDVVDELGRRGIRGDLQVEVMDTRGRDAVVRSARDAFEGGIEDADEAISVAGRAASAGAHDVAADLYRRTCKMAPNRPEAWAGFARELAASSKEARSPSSDDGKLVLLALRRARELSPGDPQYRAELALRFGRRPAAGPATATAKEDAREDERWLTPIATILARRKGVPESGVPDVSDRELHWLRAVKMHDDNRVSQLIQYAREIVIPPRTQGELFEPIPPEGDLTEILRARVHRKNGTIAFPSEEHNDGMRPRIRWPELDAGDTVEVVIRQWTSTAVGGRGDAPFTFMDYAGSPASHPLVYNEVVVETSPGRPLYVDLIHENAVPYKREEKEEKGVKILRLVWDAPMIVPEEPLAPHTSEIVPVIVGSTFKSWADFRKWYAEAIRGFTEPDEEVRRIAAELTKGKTTREEKLRALFEFVADDIRYVNYVSGEWWLPNRPQQLLARREGDCDDKAILLITLLRSIGIEAQEVMVQTRLTGQPSVLLARNAAVPMFDHGIAFLPGPNGGTYLDATSPMSRLGPLPSMDARAVALRMDNGPAEIVQLPSSSPDDHGADVTWTLEVSEDGSGKLTGEERHSGDSAFWLRTNLSQAEARAQYVEDALVSPWFSTIDVDKDIDFKGDLKNGGALVRYKASSRGIARREGKDLVLPLSASSTYGSNLAPLATRTLPVELPPHLAPSHQARTLRIVAPPGYAWGELPPGGSADGKDFGNAHLELAKDAKNPRVLQIKRRVVFDLHRIPVDRYPAWRAWIQQVDALMRKEVRLVEAK